MGARGGPTVRNHVVVIDGTLSSLEPGRETHAGRLWRLLSEGGPRAAQSVFYHPGVQGRGWRKWLNAATGEGVNDAIMAAYGALACRWRPGDRIFLFGYSRGAYAVRSLAGLIDRVGLVRVERSAERRIRRAFRYYEAATLTERALAFRDRHCWPAVDVEAVCVWDTVRALGLPLPGLSWLGARAVDFHDDALGRHIRSGYQALALDETRIAFRCVKWRRADGWTGELEQAWFPGGHADVGGDVGQLPEAAPLAHYSLVWMLERAEARGLLLPESWRDRFPCDPAAPMLGGGRGLGRLFLLRRARRVRIANDEQIHPAVVARRAVQPGYAPKARLIAPAPGSEPRGEMSLAPLWPTGRRSVS